MDLSPPECALTEKGGGGGLSRQTQSRLATSRPASILQRKRPTMRFRNLPAKRQADPRASRLGGKERNEHVGRILNPRPVISNPDVQLRIMAGPSHAGLRAALQHRIGRVVH